MAKIKILPAFCVFFILIAFIPAHGAAPAADSSFSEYIDLVFQKNSLEMAVAILINDKNFPVADVINKAREKGYGFTPVIEALIDTNLSCEDVMIAAVLNNAPPEALFDSKKISDEYHYTPEKILKFLVKELMFMERNEEELGQKDYNQETRKANIEIMLRVCKSMMEEKKFSQLEVMTFLCEADASDELMAAVIQRFDVPQSIAVKACPSHAEFGQVYISRELPQEAYIVIGVDHQTLSDDAGRGNGVISPSQP
ncbi:MAG: hypothetical protein MUE70_03910 [Desulfobacterales bacterium]|nr:hypothetical protein [Desulfobacterales bacterium]